MTITIELPDEFATAFAKHGDDPSRAVLEAVALEGYRSTRLSEAGVRRLLGFHTREEVHGFLKQHRVFLHYSINDLEHDLAEADRFLALKASHPSTEQIAG